MWTLNISLVSVLRWLSQWWYGDWEYEKESLGSHTATVICKAFENMLWQWNITKAHVVLMDNSANITKLWKNAGFHV